MPLRASGDRVVRDSSAGLWAAMFEGILDEDDFTDSRSGRLRPSLDGNLPAPSPTNWARDVHLSTPFGIQMPPFGVHRSTPPVTPERTPTRSPVAPHAPVAPVRHATRMPLSPLEGNVGRAVVHERIYKAELNWEEDKYAGQAAREGMLRRFVALAHEVETMLDAQNAEAQR